MSEQVKGAVQIREVRDNSAISHLMDTAKFEHLQRVASTMGAGTLVPAHLKGKTPQETIGNCFRVVNQAIRWGFDPFQVADETYVVSGKLGYQGKLVAAVVNTRAGLRGRLKAEYSGAGKNRTIKIIGQFQDEDTPREITLNVEQAATQNKMWTTDPDQKLWYSGVVKWARRHCPEVIMGVLTDDDLERMAPAAITDNKSIIEAKLANREPPKDVEFEPVQEEAKAEEPEAVVNGELI